MKLNLWLPSLGLASTAVICLVQPARAQLTQITGVSLNATESGLEIILDTADGSSPRFFETPDRETLYIDIANAQLRLPDGEKFRSDNPVEGIASVEVAEQFADSVTITIVGETAPPQVRVVQSDRGLVFSLTPPPSTAETPEPATPPPGVEQEPGGEQEIEIVVTGQPDSDDDYFVPEVTTGTRTETDILNVPQSVQVVPEQVIEDQQNLTVGDTLRNLSGVSTGRTGSRSQATIPVIRGFESTNLLRNGLRDDTLRDLSTTTNVERVEVLKGPASVLYGQGNLGGTVNIITKQPLLEPDYSTEFNIGNFDRYRGVLDFTGPLTANDTLSYRLTSSYENSDTFVEFEDIERRFFVSPVIALRFSENTRLTLEAEYQNEKTSGLAPELPAEGTVIDNPNGEIDITENLGEPDLAESESYVTRVGYRFEHEFSENWEIRNEFLAAFGRAPEDLNKSIISVGLRPDLRELNRVLLENPTKRDNYILNTNVVGNFNTSSIAHQLLVGVELAREELEDKITITTLAPIDIFDPEYRPDSLGAVLPQQDAESKIDSLGIYLQNQISFTENLILVLGGRFDITDVQFEDQAPAEPIDINRQDEAFTPRVGLVYKPIENLSIYGSFSRSFEPVAARSFEGEVFEPEKGSQYEIGVKAELTDRLYANLAFYNLNRENFVVQDPGRPGFQLQIGEQRSQGIELDVTGEILPGWNLIASYTYTDAEILEADQFDPGNRLNNIPEHAVSFWSTYEIQSGSLQGLGFGFGLFFEGDREGDLENSFTLPSFVRTDAALYYRRGSLRAAINFYNLFDERYFEGARDRSRVIPAAPFTVLGSITWEF